MLKRKMVRSLTAALIGTAILTGCGGPSSSAKSSSKNSSDAKTESKDEAAVIMYDSDGKTILGKQSVARGETFTPDDPEAKEGYTFMGWFVTPDMTRKYDASKAIDTDIKLYAGFVKYQKDTRDFYVVGSGSSKLLKKSNWGATVDDTMKLSRQNEPDANVYTITLDLEQGDQFQFAMDSSWDDQRGFGYMKTIAQDGKDYFKNNGSLGDANAKKANIEVLVSGNYTFTLTTYPSADYYDTEDSYYSESKKENFNLSPYDTIEFQYNG